MISKWELRKCRLLFGKLGYEGGLREKTVARGMQKVNRHVVLSFPSCPNFFLDKNRVFMLGKDLVDTEDTDAEQEERTDEVKVSEKPVEDGILCTCEGIRF